METWTDRSTPGARSALQRLRRAHVGRVAFERAGCPCVALVPIHVDDTGCIVFSTDEDPLLTDLDGVTIAVEIDGVDRPVEHDWYLTIIGQARDITDTLRTDDLLRRGEYATFHPSRLAGRLIAVAPDSFTGSFSVEHTDADDWFAGIPMS